MTELQDNVVFDKLSGETPRAIEANWAATVGAKELLTRVHEFRLNTQASYNDDSKIAVRKALEGAELELETLGKGSFNTERVLKGVRKLKVALKAAEEAIAQGPSSQQTVTLKVTDGDVAATQLEQALRGAEEDCRGKDKVALLRMYEKLISLQLLRSRNRKAIPTSIEEPTPNNLSRTAPRRVALYGTRPKLYESTPESERDTIWAPRRRAQAKTEIHAENSFMWCF